MSTPTTKPTPTARSSRRARSRSWRRARPLHLVRNLRTCYPRFMQIIAKRTLREFWLTHPLAEGSCRLWYARVSRAAWIGPADVKREFGTLVDFVAGSRVIFDLGGNK